MIIAIAVIYQYVITYISNFMQISTLPWKHIYSSTDIAQMSTYSGSNSHVSS